MKNLKNKKAKFIVSLWVTIVLISGLSFTSNIYADDLIKTAAAVTVFENADAKIDFTDSAKTGTVKISAAAKLPETKIKVTVTKNEKNNALYIYGLNPGTAAETYPLQMGDGGYTVRVWGKLENGRYSVILLGIYNLVLSDKNAPFLNTSQFVNYGKNAKAAKIAAELTINSKTDFEKFEKIYDYVINNIEYDTYKADTVQSGYVPSVDEIIDSGKGICFDYAAVMAAMLRSLEIPAKLVFGYVGPDNEYHAWNEVFLKSGGAFKTNGMRFEGQKFERADPTLNSMYKTGKKVLEYIGEDKNYMKTLEY